MSSLEVFKKKMGKKEMQTSERDERIKDYEGGLK